MHSAFLLAVSFMTCALRFRLEYCFLVVSLFHISVASVCGLKMHHLRYAFSCRAVLLCFLLIIVSL